MLALQLCMLCHHHHIYLYQKYHVKYITVAWLFTIYNINFYASLYFLLFFCLYRLIHIMCINEYITLSFSTTKTIMLEKFMIIRFMRCILYFNFHIPFIFCLVPISILYNMKIRKTFIHCLTCFCMLWCLIQALFYIILHIYRYHII